VRFSISIPQLDDDRFDDAGVKEYLLRAEALGFEGGWTLEQVVGGAPQIAPLELLAYAAACTTRLRLGVAVLITSLHDPLQLAATVTAVDRLSHGRLDLGVGHGGRSRPFSAFGVDPSTFVGYFTEGLELMKQAWSDEPTVTFHGRFRDAEALLFEPKPVQRPHPPLWMGGSAPKALARAVRLGDAFLGAGSSTTASFVDAVKIVRRELEQQGREASGFTIAKRVYVTVDDDPAVARRRVMDGLDRIYGDMAGVNMQHIEAVPVSGTSSDVIRGLRAVVDAGAEMILLNPVGRNVAEDREQMERLASEVMPHVG
jgi:alkanesulfonate monooxygenase SsuD/methylene tetrahydromethanopterin reductase-like flavin-dependent oxidoreductase (luciferase family)